MMKEYVRISLTEYEILLKKAYIVNNLLETCKSNKSNMIEEKDLNFINFGLICFKNDYKAWLKESDKDE